MGKTSRFQTHELLGNQNSLAQYFYHTLLLKSGLHQQKIRTVIAITQRCLQRKCSQSAYLGVLSEFFHSPDTNQLAEHKGYLHHTCKTGFYFRSYTGQSQRNNPRVMTILDTKRYHGRYNYIAKIFYS